MRKRMTTSGTGSATASMMTRAWALVALLAFAAALGGCLEAETLGGAEPDEVTVGSPPTWDSGIGALMQIKCGVCHSVPPSRVSPVTVPAFMDLNYQTGPEEGVLGAVDAIPYIQAGLLRGDLTAIPQMPLEYATPLTEQEISALEAWDGS